MQLPPTPPLSQKCTVKQVSTMHTWTCMKPQHQLPLLDTSLLLTHDSTTQLHNSRVSKQTRGQSHTILFLKFSLKDRNIIYDEFFQNILARQKSTTTNRQRQPLFFLIHGTNDCDQQEFIEHCTITTRTSTAATKRPVSFLQ